MRSQDCVETVVSMSSTRAQRRSAGSWSTAAQAATKAPALGAISTMPPYSAITSGTAVATTGFSPARYSSVSAGLLRRVAAPGA